MPLLTDFVLDMVQFDLFGDGNTIICKYVMIIVKE